MLGHPYDSAQTRRDALAMLVSTLASASLRARLVTIGSNDVWDFDAGDVPAEVSLEGGRVRCSN